MNLDECFFCDYSYVDEADLIAYNNNCVKYCLQCGANKT